MSQKWKYFYSSWKVSPIFLLICFIRRYIDLFKGKGNKYKVLLYKTECWCYVRKLYFAFQKTIFIYCQNKYYRKRINHIVLHEEKYPLSPIWINVMCLVLIKLKIYHKENRKKLVSFKCFFRHYLEKLEFSFVSKHVFLKSSLSLLKKKCLQSVG